jgi:hypothetical protein
LGDGTNTDRSTPVQVSGLTGVVDLEAGHYHSLAVKEATSAPTVSSVRPDSGATNVALNTSPTATFSKEMNPATLTTSTVKLYQRKSGKWRLVSGAEVKCDSP